MAEELESQDVDFLKKNLGVTGKTYIARKVGNYYNGSEVTPLGLKIAEDIFRIMVRDVEVKVREILSDSLKKCRGVPKDIVYSLIEDEDSVAVPFITYYSQLTNDDLLKILKLTNSNKQKAVAKRNNLPYEIAQYIVDECPEEVVGELISNNSIEIKESTYQVIIDKYKKSELIQKRLVDRDDLPVSVIEKIVYSMSSELQKKLVLSHNLPVDVASDIIEQVKEKATLKISEEYSSDRQIEELVHQLYSAGRLTPTLVVRSICMGDLRFFEYSLVYLSNTTITDVRKVLFGTSLDFMIRNLLRKAYIPKTMFPAVFSALKVIKDIRFDCRRSNRKGFIHKVIERILSYGSANEEMSEDDIRYLVSKIS